MSCTPHPIDSPNFCLYDLKFPLYDLNSNKKKSLTMSTPFLENLEKHP